ncbi:DUF771 domain-containing protein [Jeotgalibacillus proteolyticus]|uniref:DUF771 domain-containing protein n=1 Tax=Jeotgalibacillus proteolyticus TaxID=2082395 RepID=A0A2S5GAZ0_9BACL|nr:DUF771 domain-containing protein [Jeotgalibacillus proteolyticus]PPA70182.1 DUF771 domain-containing protein [Jeotgalibacillus proteolyticus]
MQQLSVNLIIPIPEDSVIISRVEWDRLKENELSGVYWTMALLEQRTGKKRQWLQEHILYQPKFKKTLSKFVYYPTSKGDKWSFNAKEMASFLDRHFTEIYNGAIKK